MSERVRVILDCEWEDLQHALDMVIDARPSFDRVQDRPGWGWHWSRHGKPSLFVRRTKRGYSATDLRDRDGSGEAGQTAKQAGPEGQQPGPKASPKPHPEHPHHNQE